MKMIPMILIAFVASTASGLAVDSRALPDACLSCRVAAVPVPRNVKPFTAAEKRYFDRANGSTDGAFGGSGTGGGDVSGL